MRTALALVGGFAVTVAGLVVVVTSDQDLAGVMLMAAGVLVAAIAPRSATATRD